MDREERAIWEQLGEAEEAMGFLLALLAGTGLSFAAAGVQRDALAAALRGEQGDAGAAIPLRGAANSLVVGALGFFLCLALKGEGRARRDGPAALRSARANVLAGALVLAAALIRFREGQISALCPGGGRAG